MNIYLGYNNIHTCNLDKYSSEISLYNYPFFSMPDQVFMVITKEVAPYFTVIYH